VLLALRAHRLRFMADGDRFHFAFRCMLEEAPPTWDMESILDECWDPVFGVHPGASAMLLEGMVSMLLSLDAPRMTTAHFTIARAEAQQELQEMDHADIYRDLAKTFHDQL
jgi:hypothetical protein